LTLIRRLAPYAVAVVVAIAAVAGLMWHPPKSSAAYRASYVVMAGAAGLRWDDINPADTPTLWALARKDGIAALSVRSAHKPTCPGDGWTTLGAGNYAVRTPDSVVEGCPDLKPPLQLNSGGGATLKDQPGPNGVVARNAAKPYGAKPGTLPGAVRCTVAIGPGAALAAARPLGRIDTYSPTLPDDPGELLGKCTLSIVDLGTVAANDPVKRAAQVRTVDAALAKVVAARPPDSLLLVAGLSDTDPASRLHVAIADGPGYGTRWLTSSGTSRSGYVQLIDMAPTILAALGQPIPVKLVRGTQMLQGSVRPTDPERAVSRLADVDHEAKVQRDVAIWFFWGLVIFETILLLICVPLLRRARRSAGPHGPPPVSSRLVRLAELGLVAAALAIPSAMLIDVLPWWRAGVASLLFSVMTVGIAAAGAALVTFGPWWRHGTLRPVLAAATFVTLVIGIDVVSGSHLQLNGVAGYSASDGTRYTGIGPVALGAFIVGILLVAACAAQALPDRRWRAALVAALGGVGIIVVGSPYLGSDAGGAVALTAGVCVAAAIATGGWLTFARLIWAAVAGMVVLIGFAMLDVRRPVDERGSVGLFLNQLHQGTAGAAVHQTASSDVVSTLTNPLNLLVIMAILVNVLVLIRPWGGLMRMFGLYPAVRGVMTGVAVAATLAGLLDGVGLTTAGAAAAVALPLVTLVCLRVLDHADDRTVARVDLEAVTQAAIPAAPVAGATSPAGASSPAAAAGDAGAAAGAAGAAAGAAGAAAGDAGAPAAPDVPAPAS